MSVSVPEPRIKRSENGVRAHKDLRAFEIGGPIRIILLIKDNSSGMEEVSM